MSTGPWSTRYFLRNANFDFHPIFDRVIVHFCLTNIFFTRTIARWQYIIYKGNLAVNIKGAENAATMLLGGRDWEKRPLCTNQNHGLLKRIGLCIVFLAIVP